MKSLYAKMGTWSPYVLSVLRIVAALVYLQHGLSKVFDFPVPGPSLQGVLILAAFLETVGSLFLLAGAYTRIVAFILSARWPSPISWRTPQSRSFRRSTAETWRFSIASCFSISFSPAPARGAWITR